jgi:hypothetical protein
MAYPATERYSILNSERFRELLKSLPLRTISEDGEASQTASQEGGSRTQPKITGFAWDQPTHEDQL